MIFHFQEPLKLQKCLDFEIFHSLNHGQLANVMMNVNVNPQDIPCGATMSWPICAAFFHPPRQPNKTFYGHIPPSDRYILFKSSKIMFKRSTSWAACGLNRF